MFTWNVWGTAATRGRLHAALTVNVSQRGAFQTNHCSNSWSYATPWTNSSTGSVINGFVQVENHDWRRDTRAALCVCRFALTHTRTHTHGLTYKKWGTGGRWGGFGTHDIISVRRRPALLTLPFAPGAGEASRGGGVVSLGLWSRLTSWPLTPTEETSLASARFRARSVFHDRDFLCGTGTRNINQTVREKPRGAQLSLAAEARSCQDVLLRINERCLTRLDYHVFSYLIFVQSRESFVVVLSFLLNIKFLLLF